MSRETMHLGSWISMKPKPEACTKWNASDNPCALWPSCSANSQLTFHAPSPTPDIHTTKLLKCHHPQLKVVEHACLSCWELITNLMITITISLCCATIIESLLGLSLNHGSIGQWRKLKRQLLNETAARRWCCCHSWNDDYLPSVSLWSRDSLFLCFLPRVSACLRLFNDGVTVTDLMRAKALSVWMFVKYESPQQPKIIQCAQPYKHYVRCVFVRPEVIEILLWEVEIRKALFYNVTMPTPATTKLGRKKPQRTNGPTRPLQYFYELLVLVPS